MPVVVPDSEKAVIGAVLRGTKEVQEWAASELTPGDFYDGRHQRVFKAIQAILDEGLEVNPVSVRERARVPVEAVTSCIEAGAGLAPSAIKTLLADVRTAAQARGLSAAFSEALAECNGGKPPSSVLETLESKLYSGLAGGFNKVTSDAHDVSKSVVASVMDKVDNPGRVEISTGLTLLDRAIIGLRPKFYVLAARPAVGKSAAAQSISKAVLDQPGLGVLTFSAEMGRDEILERDVAMRTGVNVRKIQSGRGFLPGELAAVIDAPNHTPRDRWRIIDQTVGIAAIRRIARIEKAKMARKGIRLVLIVLDYIQLFADGENREQAVSAVSRGCKLMSQELGVAVIGLSQLNRGLEHRDDKRPILSDLRESGAIEQDADCVAFLYRPWVYDKNQPEEQTELIIAKQRGGPVGTFPIKFSPKTTMFMDERHYGPVPQIHTGEEAGNAQHGDGSKDVHLKPVLLPESANLFGKHGTPGGGLPPHGENQAVG